MSALVRPLLEILGPSEQVPELTVQAPDPLAANCFRILPLQAGEGPLGTWRGVGKQFLCVQGLNHPPSLHRVGIQVR